ncbi:unnamed protein product, partial [Allacma fusca]
PPNGGGGGGVENRDKFHFVLVNSMDKVLARLSPRKCNTREYEPTENIPPIGAKLEFSRFDLTLPFPFVIYVTFQGGEEKNRKGKPTNEEDADSAGLRAYSFVIVRRDSMELDESGSPACLHESFVKQKVGFNVGKNITPIE